MSEVTEQALVEVTQITYRDWRAAYDYRDGIQGNVKLAETFAAHRITTEQRVVDGIVAWLLDHERCPFGKSPQWYADAIQRGEWKEG